MTEPLQTPCSRDRAMGRRTLTTALVLAGVTLILAACTNRQVYEAIQQNRQLECAKLQGTQYEECMNAYSEPYDTYQRERDAVVNAPEKGQ